MPQEGSAFGLFKPDMAVNLILHVFDGRGEPTPADVQQQVRALLESPPFAHLRPHAEEITNEVLQRTKVVIGAATTLDDDADHIEWLSSVGRDDWRFWPRLEDYLRRVEQLPPSVVQELDKSSDRTLERLESPLRSGQWDRRGLVVGHVQSGKTTHYTALAAKALDAGYQIVIILAGVHNSLRSQTHERIDRQLIGRDSAALIEAVRQGGAGGQIGVIGVGEQDRLLGRADLPCTLLTCTTSAEDGDFRTNIANQIGFQVSSGSRLVMVVKKNATILRGLIAWLRLQNATGSMHGGLRSITQPALVIDDEADHASINTSRDPDLDATTINRLIRQLLVSFDHIGFVGYTATPFANIFVQHEDRGGELGPDLFPRSFIINLKAPSDYIGPNLVFGHQGDESAGIAAQRPVPMYVPVEDASPWLPEKHRKDAIPGPVPKSLRNAVWLFVLSSAARSARGEVDTHKSMLIHATRFIDVQARIEQQVADEVNGLRDLIGMGAAADVARLESEFAELWQRLIVKDHQVFRDRLGDRCEELPPWGAVWKHVEPVLRRIQISRINGQSSDALAYVRNPQGVYVIAIGGDKLSRGLTLEGLSVSYFLRASGMYDTLMQMGRWFGYRRRYADLCRVFTTPFLYAAFRQIALAMDDLRADLDYMAAIGKTPTEFGLRVRTPSDGLLITAANKIRRGEEVSVRFAETLVQALEIASIGPAAEENRKAVLALLETLGKGSRIVRGAPTSHLLWHDVEVSLIMDFLHRYEAFSTPSFFNHCDALRRYISEQNKNNELTHWAIALVGKSEPRLTLSAGRQTYALVHRARLPVGRPDRFATQSVVGSAEEALDLSTEEYALSLKDGKVVRELARQARPARRGLLLLYLLEPPSDQPEEFVPSVALSFPKSGTARPLSYTVNPVWVEQLGLFSELDDEAAAA